MKFEDILATVLALQLVVVLFAGCSQDNPEPSPGNPTNTEFLDEDNLNTPNWDERHQRLLTEEEIRKIEEAQGD